MDHLARVDGDDVRGRVVRERDGGAARARQVAAPEIAVVVENEERGGADGDLTHLCGRERGGNGKRGPASGHVRGFLFQRRSIQVDDERVRVADFDLLDGRDGLMNPGTVGEFRAPHVVVTVHVKMVRATDGHLNASSVAVVCELPVARAVDGTTPHVSTGRVDRLRDSDERIVAGVKVNHTALGDARGDRIVRCLIPVGAGILIEIGVARPGERSIHGV